MKWYLTEVIKITGTNGGSILVYSKEENAIAERFNKEVIETNKRDAWSIFLPFAQRIRNSKVHSKIGVSPNDLVFFKKIDLQGGFLDPPVSVSKNIKNR